MPKFPTSIAIIAVVFIMGCSGDSNLGSEANPSNISSEAPAKDAPTMEIGSCNSFFAQGDSDEDAIGNVLHGEGSLVVAQDIDTLMSLWSDDSVIADAKNTPKNSDDDQTWQGKDAIRHRYVRIVFPGAPSVAKPSNLNIEIDGSEAIVLATTNIGEEISPHGDEWRLINNDGCWTIKSLTYNLEEQ